MSLNQLSLPDRDVATMPILANPNALQSLAFELLKVDPKKFVPRAEEAGLDKKK